MKKYSISLAVLALVFASLACQTVMGGGDTPTMPQPGGGVEPPQQPTMPPGMPDIPTIPPIATDDNGNVIIGGESEFPMPDDAKNVVSMGSDLLTFQTQLSMAEAMKFYRDAFGELGYTERKADTFSTDAMFTLIFDGHQSGKAITVQGINMGSNGLSVTITLAGN